MTQYQQSNYWIDIRENKVMRIQQQGLAIPNSDSVKPAKPFIPDKYNNWMEMKKLKRKKTLPRHSCNLDLVDLLKRRLESVPILHMGCRRSFCGTKNFSLAEKFMWCA